MDILREIHELLLRGFNDEELRNLCFQLRDIEYEDLEGQGRAGKARELVRYMDRRGRLQELVDLAAELRPTLPWPETIPSAPVQEQDGPQPQPLPGDAGVAGESFPEQAGPLPTEFTIWSEPYGEPDWVRIPAGPFWLGSDSGRDNERPEHEVPLDTFFIARFPITNAQYNFFVQDTGYRAPEHWFDGRIPTGYANHPVRHVSFYDALAYCRWLSEVTGRAITLPSEAQWEKAARGPERSFVYPWGTAADPARANTAESSRSSTSPVDRFRNGASPYGVIDTCGNIWEWTRSLYKPYPYVAGDGREADGDGSRVLRGGAFVSAQSIARCSYRSWERPDERQSDDGFRAIRQE